jgi:hypothetical protein
MKRRRRKTLVTWLISMLADLIGAIRYGPATMISALAVIIGGRFRPQFEHIEPSLCGHENR